MKSKSTFIILVLVSFGAGLGAAFAVDVIRELACNVECKAQLLYKNPAFFDVRSAVSAIKKNPDAKVVLDQARYTPEYLRRSGIDLLVVTSSGEFVVTSRLSRLAMLAKPTFEANRLIWHCEFFSDTGSAPGGRPCSY